MRRHRGTLVLVVIAAAAALVPVPADVIERLYSRGVYPPIQQALTLATNSVSIALLDIAIAVLLLTLVWVTIVRVRRAGWRGAAGPTLVTLVRTGAVVYLAFLVMWGLNYRRVPLEQKLDYDRNRMTRNSVTEFANRAARAINDGYGAAHGLRTDLAGLGYAFSDAEFRLGARSAAIPGVPKRSLLTVYFRRAAIDGMTDPIFLEIIVNPDVLEIERPMVVAHEWGHLAGYANESEANFIAWLTCIRGDALARYSGWLSAYEHAVRALPEPIDPRSRRSTLGLGTICARWRHDTLDRRQSSGRRRESVYDEYLRANRVRRRHRRATTRCFD